ncbi:MAG: hypothetical protein VYA84_11200 [Planctomycetota bacterium]|nr:hypothetical protein [Planctomycetota bacterium]
MTTLGVTPALAHGKRDYVDARGGRIYIITNGRLGPAVLLPLFLDVGDATLFPHLSNGAAAHLDGCRLYGWHF